MLSSWQQVDAFTPGLRLRRDGAAGEPLAYTEGGGAISLNSIGSRLGLRSIGKVKTLHARCTEVVFDCRLSRRMIA